MTLSLSDMFRLCHSWPAEKFPSPTEAAARREAVLPALESVVSLPDRLNTEHAVEVISCATRLVMLAEPSTLDTFVFVLSLAALQIRSSIKTRESAERWLEFRDASFDCQLEGTAQPLELIQSTVLALLRCMREVESQQQQHVSSPAVVASIRYGCASVASSLFEATYAWQTPEAVKKFASGLNSLMPPPAGLWTFLASQLSDTCQVQQYQKRGLTDFKKDRETLLQQNVALREELIKLCVSARHFYVHALGPSSFADRQGAQGWHACVVQIVSILKEPYYKSRDLGLVRTVLNSLITLIVVSTSPKTKQNAATSSAAATSPAAQSEERSFLKQLWSERAVVMHTVVELLAPPVVPAAAPSKDELKEKYTKGEAVKKLPLWDPWCRAAVVRLLSVMVQCFSTLPSGMSLAVPTAVATGKRDGTDGNNNRSSEALVKEVGETFLLFCRELASSGRTMETTESLILVLQPLWALRYGPAINATATTRAMDHNNSASSTDGGNAVQSPFFQWALTKTNNAAPPLHEVVDRLCDVALRALRRHEPLLPTASAAAASSSSLPLSTLGGLVPAEVTDTLGALQRLVQHTVTTALPLLKRLAATNATSTSNPFESAYSYEVQVLISLGDFLYGDINDTSTATTASDKRKRSLVLRSLKDAVYAVRGGPLANYTVQGGGGAASCSLASQADVALAQLFVLHGYALCLRVLHTAVVGPWLVLASSPSSPDDERRHSGAASSAQSSCVVEHYREITEDIAAFQAWSDQLSKQSLVADNAVGVWRKESAESGGALMALQQTIAQTATVLIVAYSGSTDEESSACASTMADKLVGVFSH